MSEPTVRETDPPLPDWVFRVVNPALGLLLRSPLHGLVSDDLLLLRWRGRHSGQEYTTPVGYREPAPGRLLVFTHSGWWHNFETPAPVEVLLRGEWHEAEATADPDPERVADYVYRVASEDGLEQARRLGVAIEGETVPDRETIAAAVEDSVVVDVVLAD